MEYLKASFQEGKLICCNSRTLRRPTHVCITIGCNTRLVCEYCSQYHPSGHKSIAIKEFIRKTIIPTKKSEQDFIEDQPSEQGLKAKVTLVIHETENLLKSLKKTLKTFDSWRANARETFLRFEENMKEMVSKPSQISNNAFSKIYDLITIANVGQTKNFLPDFPVEEMMLILQHGAKVTQEFTEVIDKMLPEIPPKNQLIIVDGQAMKKKLQPFINKYIKKGKEAPKKSSYLQVINIESADEEEKAENLNPKLKIWQQDYKKIENKVNALELELTDIELLIEKTGNVSEILSSKQYKYLEAARNEYLRLEEWIQKTKKLKQIFLADVKKFNDEKIIRKPQHPKKFKKAEIRLKNELLQRQETKMTRNEFLCYRKNIMSYGFKKLWKEYLEAFKVEEQFVSQEVQQEPSKEYKAVKARFISQLELVFQQENFKETMAMFIQACELYQELENFVLYLKRLNKGVNLYVLGKKNEKYLSKFPDLQQAIALQEKIEKIGVVYPQELSAELHEQTSSVAVFQLMLSNQQPFSDPKEFKDFIVKNAASLKLNFPELKEAKKKLMSNRNTLNFPSYFDEAISVKPEYDRAGYFAFDDEDELEDELEDESEEESDDDLEMMSADDDYYY